MSGSDLNLDVEDKMMAALVSRIADDGLLYCPPNTPWRTHGRGYLPTDEDYTAVYADARMMLAMMAWHQRDNDPIWLDRIQKMAKGLGKVAVYAEDRAFYPDGGVAFDFSYLKQSGWKNQTEPSSERQGAEGTVKFYNANQIRALARWHQLSGDKEALELARKLANFVLKPSLWEEGALEDLVGPERAQWQGHFHGHITTFMGLLWYALTTNNVRLTEFVRSGYEYSRNFGIARIGWFPCWIGPNPIGHKLACESCGTADMVALAVKLSTAGVADYWDDVDGYVRNTLVEQQYADVGLTKAATKQGDADWTWWLGAFCGAGDLSGLNTNAAACCTGNSTQALYYAWDSIVRYEDGTAQVNLLLNRASPWLDVDSYLPYEGKVVLKNKTARTVAVRIPSWVDPAALTCQVSGKDTSPFWVGRYLVLDRLGEQDEVTIEFPIVEERVTYTVPAGEWCRGGPMLPRRQYLCSFRGSTLVDISPRDENPTYPIYLRSHYASGRVPMMQVTRHIAPSTIRW